MVGVRALALHTYVVAIRTVGTTIHAVIVVGVIGWASLTIGGGCYVDRVVSRPPLHCLLLLALLFVVIVAPISTVVVHLRLLCESICCHLLLYHQQLLLLLHNELCLLFVCFS